MILLIINTEFTVTNNKYLLYNKRTKSDNHLKFLKTNTDNKKIMVTYQDNSTTYKFVLDEEHWQNRQTCVYLEKVGTNTGSYYDFSPAYHYFLSSNMMKKQANNEIPKMFIQGGYEHHLSH